MKVGDSVRLGIDDWERREYDAAMLHACNAVDGTAKKIYPNLRNRARFTQLLRDNYGILGPMGMPGINISETRFPVRLDRSKASGGTPDIADLIYGIHRCTHGHGDELPDGFELITDAAGSPMRTRMRFERGKVQLSDRIIFGLLAVAILSPVNVGQTVPEGYHLTFGHNRLEINEWWGRADAFEGVVESHPVPQVKMDFTEWMDWPDDA